MLKRILFVAAILAYLLAPRAKFRTMTVEYIHTDGYVTLFDSDGNSWGIWADDVQPGDRLVCTCYGNGESMEIRSYWKEGYEQLD